MNFWSKGLGKKTIDLYLGKGEAQKGVDRLYVKGRVEAPVSWEYIILLHDEDLADFFALLRDPAMADYVYRMPGRWRLLAQIAVGGLKVVGLVLAAGLSQAFGKDLRAGEVELEMPPPSVKKRTRTVRARLGSKRLSMTTPEDGEEEEPPASSQAAVETG